MKRLVVVLCMLAGLGAFGIYLFTAPACACGDIFPVRVYRFATWNPMRDRTPELAADNFLRDQGQGKCRPAASDLCTYALKSRPVLGWRLAAREGTKTGVLLYYRVKSQDSSQEFWGQAMLELSRQGNEWRVTSYSAGY
jgi:hypothetical protein